MTMTKADLLNFVVNQPEVLVQMAPNHKLVDMSSFFDRPKNLMFGNEHGVVIFAYLGDGLYEGHYLLTDTITPKEAMRLCRRALREVFTTHGASAINGATPRGNLGARAFNRALGFAPVGSTFDTAGRPCIKYRLERSKWVASSAPESD